MRLPIAVIALVLAVAAITATQLPDVKRYLKMRAM